MRAITGAVVSSKPCSLAKATRILALFADSAASDLPSSDAATYLRTATEAASDLHVFRRDLRRYQQQGGDGADAYEGVGRGVGGESEKKQKRQRRAREAGGEEDGVTVRAAVPQGDVSEKKSEKKKGAREDEEPREEKQGEDEEIAAPHIGLHSPASEKRKRKEKLVKEENETGNANAGENRKALENGLQGLLSKEGIDKEKKEKKKKKHVKQEEEVRGVKEPEQKMVHIGVAEHGLASEEKKSKKRKHTEEEQEKKGIVTDGDLGSDKKRKKKRGRDGDNGNNMELVEHTKKKQRK